MKNVTTSRLGFTLIELLVVVLIIGILASVALPQYTKAVDKSRLTQALEMVRVLQDRVDLYILENGLPSSFSRCSELGILDDIPEIWKDSSSKTYYIGDCYLDSTSVDLEIYGKITLTVGKGNFGNVSFSPTVNDINRWTKGAYCSSKEKYLCDFLIGQGWERDPNQVE